MLRRAVLAVSLTAVLAVPAASAKEVEKVEVCGAEGCADVTGKVGESLFFDMTTPGDPPRASAFLRVRFTVGDGSGEHHETFAMLVTADGRHLRSGGPDGAPAWFDMTSEQTAALRRAIRGAEPFPASRMPATKPYEPPTARVVETFSPADATTDTATDTATADDGGSGVAAMLLGGGALLALLAGAAVRRRRLPRDGVSAT